MYTFFFHGVVLISISSGMPNHSASIQVGLTIKYCFHYSLINGFLEFYIYLIILSFVVALCTKIEDTD